MEPLVQYRLMQAGEEEKVSDLAIRGFKEYVAYQYSEEGVKEFLKYVEPHCLSNRCKADSFVLLAVVEGRIVGMIEVVVNNHISLFYTDGHLQRMGIGRELLKISLDICKGNNPTLSEITVNSSPNAVHIYEKLGFCVVEPEKVSNGIRYVSMSLGLSKC